MENRFLYRVAKDIIDNELQGLQDTMIVLPNRRAKRFLLEEIKEIKTPPFFSPEIRSVDDLVSSKIEDKKKADNLSLLYYLYKSYCNVYYSHHPLAEGQQQETFSEFYSWGSMLLNDFDELDKNLVNAQTIYTNLDEYSSLKVSASDILTQEQRAYLERFFAIDFEQSAIMQNFVKIWNCLYEIYEDFNNTLKKESLAYSGMLYREFVQRLERDEISFDCKSIKIAGFSVLNASERKIFRLLKEKYDTTFYWDYDKYYSDSSSLDMPPHEAGIFIRENKMSFPMNESFSKNNFDRISTSKQDIRFIKCTYESSSVTYIKQWLQQIEYDNPKDVAIILNDESLIPMALKSIDKDVKTNITMGYPFRQSELYNDVLDAVLSLSKQEFTQDNVSKKILALAERYKKDKVEAVWQLDVLKAVDEKMKDFSRVFESIAKEDLTETIMADVIKKDLNSMSIDLQSEAMDGIQVMGLLETRTLDFKYILMLSTTDNNLPNVSRPGGFIPDSFRKAYNMFSLERKVGLFAYYFYRLLHTAERMDIVYTTDTTEGVREISRFCRQLKVELPKEIKEYSMVANYAEEKFVKDYTCSKEDFPFIESSSTKYPRRLAPSNINSLLDCELKFYLNDVRYIREQSDNDGDSLDADFGTAFHNAANFLYEKYDGNPALISNIEDAAKEAVEKALEEIEGDENQARLIRNITSMHKDMLVDYLKKLIEDDKLKGVKNIQGEQDIQGEIEVDGKKVLLKGRIDRIDTDKNGQIRIVDYKTGKKSSQTGTILLSDAFECNNKGARKSKMNYLFEILMYCYLLYHSKKGKVNIQPCLQYLSDIKDTDIMVDKQVLIYNEQTDKEFTTLLQEKLRSLLNKPEGEVYKRNINDATCKYCGFKLLCGVNTISNDNF
ncbi:MAG: PD-(D/E)XK nuclease family protein [Bacteroidales bacterium]|nr:PD-(D/E)XK nuclease family protein [Bacteroidales bacterium]